MLYRMRSLEKAGIIEGYNTIVNFTKLGFTGFAVFCRFEGIGEEKKRGIIERLVDFPQVYWVGLCGGRFDISFGILCKSVFEFNNLYYKFCNEYSEHIAETAIAIRTELWQNTRNYLISDSKAREMPSFFFGKEPEIEKIDSMDSDILSIISVNARMPVTEISGILNKPLQARSLCG